MFHPDPPRVALVALAGLVAALVGSCRAPIEPLRPDSGREPEVDAGLSGPVTYYEHVRPILVENCVTCHTEGGVAPFPLETYEQVSEVGERVHEVTRDRIMPPFLADNSGECNTWLNYRGLEDREIAIIARWVGQGRERGEPSGPPPTPGALPALERVDLRIEMPGQYAIDGSIDDDYRCFVVDPGLEADSYVTGYDVHPGNAQRVHHVIVYNPTDENQAQRARNLDLEDGRPGDGYPCFGGPRVDAPPLVLWAPGTGSTRFPRGTGVELNAGRSQIIQVHYNNLVEDAPTDDLTRVDLMLAETANRAYFVPLADYSFRLPPRMPSVSTSRRQELGFLPTRVRVWGVMPHMHTLGRQLNVQVNRADGADECLIDVPRWDFNWQLPYWLSRPVTISPEDAGTITCTYSTMERDAAVTWGDGTQDEMCLAFVYVTL